MALLAVGFGPTVAPAGAAKPPATDVMFIFDTSGSMSSVLTEAKEEIKTLIANTQANLPNVQFGVANVEDVPAYDGAEFFENFSESEYATNTEKPWHLWQSLTTEDAKVEEAINNLSGSEVAHSGGDGQEAYGRALYESATNPDIKWRPGSRHEIVMIADQVPHTPNVNEGIPAELWQSNPFETGEEPEGAFGIHDTQWKTGESLEFHKTLQKLDAEEKPLAMVDYYHTGEEEGEGYIHYWEYWAAATGGQAIAAQEESKSLDGKLEKIITESAEGIPPCPPGYERGATTPCVKKPTPVVSTPAPTPVYVPPTTPPGKGKTIVLESGEIEEEYEFPESGEAEDSGEVVDGAEASRFQAGTLLGQLGSNQAAFIAKKKSKKCKKGYVKKGKKCVNNAPLSYGSMKLTIPAAGKYKFKLKPSGKVLAALKKGKTLNVKTTLKFVPKGTVAPILTVSDVKVHLKPKAKHGKGKGKKGKK